MPYSLKFKLAISGKIKNEQCFRIVHLCGYAVAQPLLQMPSLSY